jgi:hypothetical protein
MCHEPHLIQKICTNNTWRDQNLSSQHRETGTAAMIAAIFRLTPQQRLFQLCVTAAKPLKQQVGMPARANSHAKSSNEMHAFARGCSCIMAATQLRKTYAIFQLT